MSESVNLMENLAGGEHSATVAKLVEAIGGVLGSESLPVVATAVGEEERARRAVLRSTHREVLRQGNIERILQLAAAEIDVAESDKSETPVDDGWLLHFFECAQDACYETTQHMLARILAREIAVPGSFSRRTLIFLNSLDRWEVDSFIEYCAFAFAFESGWRFMFQEDAARREMWSYGREIDITQHLINLGLLSAELGRTRVQSARGLRIRYFDKTYGLLPEEPSPRLPFSDDIGFSYRKFTTIGQQLAEVITPKRFFGYARNLINALDRELRVKFALVEETRETSAS
jgi:hypothetical protein